MLRSDGVISRDSEPMLDLGLFPDKQIDFGPPSPRLHRELRPRRFQVVFADC
jgi:hypothetical protein